MVKDVNYNNDDKNTNGKYITLLNDGTIMSIEPPTQITASLKASAINGCNQTTSGKIYYKIPDITDEVILFYYKPFSSIK